MSPRGFVNCQAFGPQGPLLTNRMTELVTYGSVGGVGCNPGPYPALAAAMTHLFPLDAPLPPGAGSGQDAIGDYS